MTDNNDDEIGFFNPDNEDYDYGESINMVDYVNNFTNKHVIERGKIKNQYIFEDTAQLFSKITKKRIHLNIQEGMILNLKSGRGERDMSEAPLIRSSDGAYYVTIPADHELAESEQDIYSYFLMRPLAQIFGKTDKRNLEILLADNEKLNQAAGATKEIWETTEAHRIESFYKTLRLGTYSDIQRLNKKSFDDRKVNNVIDIVKAIHCNRSELVQKKYKDLVAPISTLLSRVEQSDATATNIITKRIFEVIEQELKKEQQKEQQKEQKKKEKQGQQALDDQQPQPQQPQDCNHSPEYLKFMLNKKLERAAKMSNANDVKKQNFKKIEINTEITNSDNDVNEEERLNESNSKGEDIINKIAEQLAKEQQKEDEGVKVDIKEIDEEMKREDRIGTTDPYKKYDKTLSRQLKHLFQNMQTKFSNIKSESTGSLNIGRTIQHMAGDRNIKVYDRNIRQVGVNIRFVIDCSSSMGQGIYKGDGVYDYYFTKMKAAKELLLTMLDATKGLEQYINVKVIAYSSYGVPEIDSKRIETLKEDGSTPTDMGIRAAHNDLKKITKGEKLIIHLTDGEPDNRNSAKRVIELAERDGIKIFTVMLTKEEKLRYDKYKDFEYMFGKGKFEPIYKWNDARRIMINKVANSILDMLQGY